MRQLKLDNPFSGDPGLGLLHVYMPDYAVVIIDMQVKRHRQNLVILIKGSWQANPESSWQIFSATFPLDNWRELYVATAINQPELKRRIFLGLYQVVDPYGLKRMRYI